MSAYDCSDAETVYTTAYYTERPSTEEQDYWDQGQIKPDQLSALAYAFGLASWPISASAEGTALQQVTAIYQIRKRTPVHVLEVGTGRGEVSVSLSHLDIAVTSIDSSPAVPDLIDVTRIKFQMQPKGRLTFFNEPFGQSVFHRYPAVDTIILTETLEHIPADEFDMALRLVHRCAEGLLIITNKKSFHPILEPDGRDHVRVIDDTVYDQLETQGKRIIREGSHLVIAWGD
jgi:hypothetical protein